MTKKRVHEIAKDQGMSSKDVLTKLQAAGLDVTAASSTVEEGAALKALGANGGGPQPPARPPPAAAPPPAQPPPAPPPAATPGAPAPPRPAPPRPAPAPPPRPPP